MDLQITQARLPGHSALWDLAIANGMITHLTESQLEAQPDPTPTHLTLNAQGQLVIPGLVDAHIHLDKVFLLERCSWQDGSFAEALRETLTAKQAFTVDDIQMRARKTLETAIACGTTAMRSHVEVDPVVQLTGLTALLPLRQEYAWGITLQLAAFAQEGITNHPGTEELLRQAMDMGADVIGSAPYTDPDPEQNIRIVFDMAQACDRDVDFHLDFLDNDTPLLLPIVVRETIARGWQGRVCLGHMTRLASLPPDQLAIMAALLREAGISILALPSTDLYMMARQDTHNTRRGVAPVHTLAQMDVNTGIATNNVQNLFTPFGDADLLKICTLTAQVLHLRTPQEHEHCLAMAATNAAHAIGLPAHAIAPGSIADLVVLNAASVTEAIGAAPMGRTVIKRGRVVAHSKLERQLQVPLWS